MAQGVQPVNLITGIVAALRFDHPADPIAHELQARLATDGIRRVLAEVCELPVGHPLHEAIVEHFGALP
jgi:hypothetical protein